MLPSAVQADRNPNPKVIPSQARPYGKTYGQWGAQWWVWASTILPLEQNPIVDPTGEFCTAGQSGPVFFLAGTFGDPATRTCTVPAGKALFFPIVNAMCWAPEDVEAFGSLKACTDFYMSHVTVLEAEVNGIALADLPRYRAASPDFTLPAPNIFGLDGPRTSRSDGFWLMLAPLSAGGHQVHFRGVLDFPEWEFTFEVDATYHLTVE